MVIIINHYWNMDARITVKSWLARTCVCMTHELFREAINLKGINCKIINKKIFFSHHKKMSPEKVKKMRGCAIFTFAHPRKKQRLSGVSMPFLKTRDYRELQSITWNLTTIRSSWVFFKDQRLYGASEHFLII